MLPTVKLSNYKEERKKDGQAAEQGPAAVRGREGAVPARAEAVPHQPEVRFKNADGILRVFFKAKRQPAAQALPPGDGRPRGQAAAGRWGGQGREREESSLEGAQENCGRQWGSGEPSIAPWDRARARGPPRGTGKTRGRAQKSPWLPTNPLCLKSKMAAVCSAGWLAEGEQGWGRCERRGGRTRPRLRGWGPRGALTWPNWVGKMVPGCFGRSRVGFLILISVVML